jgi:hypothetical protein
MGETRFRNLVAEELEESGVPNVDKSSGKLPVDVRGA